MIQKLRKMKPDSVYMMPNEKETVCDGYDKIYIIPL